jgi:hypothetical protein
MAINFSFSAAKRKKLKKIRILYKDKYYFDIEKCKLCPFKDGCYKEGAKKDDSKFTFWNFRVAFFNVLFNCLEKSKIFSTLQIKMASFNEITKYGLSPKMIKSCLTSLSFYLSIFGHKGIILQSPFRWNSL